MELVGRSIKLRSVEDSDLDDLCAWWDDPEFAGPFIDDRPKSREEVRKLVVNNDGQHTFIMESSEDERKIGFISYYWTRSDYPYLYEIGYRIKPAERGKGYTTEAARLLVDHLFTTKDIERIESVTDAENLPSQRVLEKNGFRREGELRKRVRLHGEYRNEYIYALLKEEWKELKSART